MTRPAFTSQQGKAYQGDIVVETNGCLTIWAVRGRQDDGFFVRKPVDADIEKAPHNGTKEKTENKRYPVHSLNLPFSLSRPR